MKDDKPVIAADAPQAADEKTVIMTGAMLPNDDKTVIIQRQQVQTVTDQALDSVPDDSTVIMGRRLLSPWSKILTSEQPLRRLVLSQRPYRRQAHK